MGGSIDFEVDGGKEVFPFAKKKMILSTLPSSYISQSNDRTQVSPESP
jgi:hypothetical protein